ncbi:hypothetical protein HHK36_011735 [Tetracentron sinense]|uniref:Vinorine synthase n=1 Tax=Tetracentron sinense TaxID=13715 RepID=A0A834ZC75_TETSI|nr:hypothetical protein HHK36_011735 [Tetracentron sinense]
MAKVEIISREIIKPSSPTPHHLTNFTLSFLDQLAPPVYVPIFLFYSAHADCNIGNLKNSLSATLTLFYPVAGRIKDGTSVDCNDDGADYFVAQVSGTPLSDFLGQPKPDVLKLLLPCEPNTTWSGSGTDVLLAIQVNVFDCGGLAIGVCISHKIADAASLATFVGTWSAIARGATEIVVPRFDLASFFPPRDLSGFMASTGIIRDKIVTNRFVFDASNIAALRAKAATAGTCTRVEALSAFIWSRFLALFTERKAGTENMHVLMHAVNLRKRMDPPLPQHSFGNVWRQTMTMPLGESDKDSPRALEGLVRDAIRKIDGEYVRKFQEGDEYMKNIIEIGQQFSKGEVVLFCFSSWCWFPFYEVDFGWGKPTWVCTTTLPFKNVVIFMDTKSGDGIEAWVNMLEDDMAEFERDPELFEFTSSGRLEAVEREEEKSISSIKTLDQAEKDVEEEIKQAKELEAAQAKLASLEDDQQLLAQKREDLEGAIKKVWE